jgi:hypothetical protein
MSLELLNTLGTLTTVVIVAATAIAALVQLRHLRAGNQINAMLTIGDELDSESFRHDTLLIRSELEAAMNNPAYRAYDVAMVRNEVTSTAKPEYQELRRAVNQVRNSYETLGILVKHGIVDNEMFLENYANVILANWKKLEQGIALARRASETNAIWENFEYLAVVSEDWMKRYPSSYPRGVRHMEITLPWPVAAAATS